MKQTTLIVLIVLAVAVIAAAVFLFSSQRLEPQTVSPPASLDDEGDQFSSVRPSSDLAGGGDESASGVLTAVVYDGNGFSPRELKVRVGDTVVFRNGSGLGFWPASAFHPDHRVYPGSEISKCGTIEEAKIFDACRPIAPDGSWSFSFDERGTWRYHDHLNPDRTGAVVVE